MVNSPTKTPPQCLNSSKKWRPPTPHPLGKTFDFAGVENSTPNHIGEAFDFSIDEIDHADVPPTGGCIGISLATVMNTFRGLPLPHSLPTSPLSIHGDDGDMFYRFHRFRSAVQKTLTCAANKAYRPNNSNSAGSINDRHVSFDCECETFEQERSLMQRAASWGTQETGYGSSLNGGKSSESNLHVQFHYPPITSLRLRPRTESEDIKELFFAPEELDEIEDDRSDTRAADDIETLAVGEIDDWNVVPTCTSSIVTASDDDQDSRSGLRQTGNGASNVMFDQALSPRKRDRSAGQRRFVRGVQIMLREKSTG